MSDDAQINYWGSFVFSYRRLHDLTQDQLAEKLNVSQQTVSRWEAGQQIPDPRSQAALRAVLGESDLQSVKAWTERVRRSSGYEVLLDTSLKIVAISRSISDSFDILPEACAGRPIADYFPKDRPKFMEQAQERGFFEGALSGVHYTVTVDEGTRSVFFDVNLWPAMTSDMGIFMHLVCVPMMGVQRRGRDGIEVTKVRFEENDFVGNAF